MNKDHDYALEGTININKASTFYIVPSDGSHPNEFMMVYYEDRAYTRSRMLRRGSSSLNVHLEVAIRPMPRYLKADANVTGKNTGPITMDMKVDETCARLVLQSRILSKKHQVVMDMTSWVTGRDAYFIRCARRRFKKEGFLCVKFKPSQDRVPPYRLKIVQSTDNHNDENKFMLFRLLPATLKQQIKPEAEEVSDDSQSGSEELEKLNSQYRRFSEWHLASTWEK